MITATSTNQSIITPKSSLPSYSFDQPRPSRSAQQTAAQIITKHLPLILRRKPERQCLLSMENAGSRLEAIPGRS
uniref:Uncharacterized protein n=1 Tax=Arundo donax TaxID=35708 RepID=A0A0A9FDE1_ARUDO